MTTEDVQFRMKLPPEPLSGETADELRERVTVIARELVGSRGFKQLVVGAPLSVRLSRQRRATWHFESDDGGEIVVDRISTLPR